MEACTRVFLGGRRVPHPRTVSKIEVVKTLNLIHCCLMAGNQLEKNCLVCKIPFKCYRSNEHKYCSRKCRYVDCRGSKNPAFKGGTTIDKNGYVRVRGFRLNGKRRYEHQRVMEVFLGRPLRPGEEIHHINGVKTDNQLENLFLVDKRGHSRKHFELFVEVQKLKRENELLREENKRLKCRSR